MDNLKIIIAKDFSRTPGARTPEEGPFPGCLFRDQLLVPKLKNAIENGIKLIVDLDGVSGLGTSFLEEAFGGLIRESGFKYSEIVPCLQIKSEEDETYKDEIMQYLKDANEVANKQA
jgi:hypothetical protein